MAIYRKQQTKKDKIVLHHTMSSHNAINVIAGWEKNDNFVSTPYIIDGTGFVHSVYPDKYWSYNLGIKEPNHFISKACVPIELTNWGNLSYRPARKKTKSEEKEGYYNAYGKYQFALDSKYVYQNKYREFNAWHKYTDQQLEATYDLIADLADTHDIDLRSGILEYRDEPLSMFCLNEDALNGKPGLWMHCNFRIDKLDLHPQPELIEMLLSL